jgi:hypothetical protein
MHHIATAPPKIAGQICNNQASAFVAPAARQLDISAFVLNGKQDFDCLLEK